MLHNYRTLQITPLVLSDLPDAATPIDLPMCELSRLFEIREVIEGAMSSPIRRERLAIALQSESYIPVRELEIIPFSIIDHCLLLPYPGLSSLSMLTLWASVLILTFPDSSATSRDIPCVRGFREYRGPAPTVRHLQKHLPSQQKLYI